MGVLCLLLLYALPFCGAQAGQSPWPREQHAPAVGIRQPVSTPLALLRLMRTALGEGDGPLLLTAQSVWSSGLGGIGEDRWVARCAVCLSPSPASLYFFQSILAIAMYCWALLKR